VSNDFRLGEKEAMVGSLIARWEGEMSNAFVHTIFFDERMEFPQILQSPLFASTGEKSYLKGISTRVSRA
jgi:hypothetical protein